MVSSSKILTVSYGTFSCTLEGFDDSFETMKSIAEYFRDLASDDRYFGAEPPTPDAEMLAKIAEREIARRVEAHDNDGQIVLRAGQATAIAGAAAVSAGAAGAVGDENDSLEDADTISELETETAVADVETNLAELVAEDSADEAEVLQETTDDVVDAEMSSEEEAPKPAVDEIETAQDAEESFEDVEEADAGQIEEAAEASAETDETEIAEVEEETVSTDAASDAADEDLAGPEPEIEAAAANDEVLHEDELEANEADEVEAFDNEGDTDPQADTETDTNTDADTVSGNVVASSDAADEQSVEQPAPESAEAFFAGTDVDTASDSPEISEEAGSVNESVAAKLQRIRSVVSKESAKYDETDYSEDEHAVDAADGEADEPIIGETQEPAAQDTSETSKSIEEAFAADAKDVVETDDQALDLTDFGSDSADGDIAEIARDLDEDTAEDSEAGESLFADLNDVLEDHNSEELPDKAEEVTLVLEDEARVEESAAQEDLTAEEEKSLQDELAAVEAELETQSSDVPVEPEKAQQEAAEVPADEEVADEVASEDAAIDDKTSEYDAAVAALVNESPEDFANGQDVAGLSDDEDYDSDQKPRRGLARLLGVGRRETADVERIFDKADSQMGDKDSSMRRTAIQHLRAAVAATRADEKAGVEVDTTADEAPYRSDLEKAVRPRRPQADEQAAARPSSRPLDQGSAPLKLVAEQRVDQDREPIKPRRTTSQPLKTESLPTASGESGFMAFAEKRGASDISEVLEAAASYMSDVEGRPEFSRPMLMSKLKEVKSDTFSREDGLRSFGQLLREGKLRKLKGGRFSITEETEFRQEKRSAG